MDGGGLAFSLPFRSFVLDNGLRVFVHHDAQLPLVCVNLWYCVGSKDERAGRTGFAHLFEHLMFEGSANVPAGRFDEWLEAAGASNNGSTSPDRTNYWILAPSGALELALFLEADRMAGLDVSAANLETQRDVVMNERRQSYENRPYGLAYETMLAAAYPHDHPYSWPTIGHMADIAAATLDDVRAFYHTYYTPANALLAIAGDVAGSDVEALVQRHFGAIPSAPPPPRTTAPLPVLDAPRQLVLEDDVKLPRIDLAWHTPPLFTGDDAELDIAAAVLARGRASRLYRRLVHEEQIAQSVHAYQDSGQLGSLFFVSATARPGVAPARLEAALREEVVRLVAEPVEARGIERARHGTQTDFADALESVGGFDGRADRLNRYAFYTGDAAFLHHDLQRFERVSADSLQQAARRWLDAPAVALHVVPRGGAGEDDG
jgi:zinc protease